MCHRLWRTCRAHIRTILGKADTPAQRDWYAGATATAGYGWSRNVLLNMMMNRSMDRTGTAPSNFTKQLAEHDLEQALADRIAETLQELGPGFAFVGRQVHFGRLAVSRSNPCRSNHAM